ncbi:EamA family transporter [Streptomyces durhamensis]|uniref:EamA family transporter n=1 Tax=Streptomyces durhamensis TaxID=68194 RepID=UPI00068F577E|nr:EamA family transporter [Streptomyces durhamensis]
MQVGTRLLAPGTLVVAAVVAVLSSLLPCTFHLEALRQLPPRVFGVLTCLEPAVGALIGLFLLGQHLARTQWAGVAAVVLASVGATRKDAPEEPDRALPEEKAPPTAGSWSWVDELSYLAMVPMRLAATIRGRLAGAVVPETRCATSSCALGTGTCRRILWTDPGGTCLMGHP